MAIIVTDDGFRAADWVPGFLGVADLAVSDTAGHALDLALDADPESIRPFLDQIALVRIGFETFADGRGFSLARRLRLMGYRGRLRASGHILADQYPHARRCGFDEVEIPDALAARQPEDQWLAHANWRRGDYRARLARTG